MRPGWLLFLWTVTFVVVCFGAKDWLDVAAAALCGFFIAVNTEKASR